MAGSEAELKPRILAEIAAHARVYGREQWDLLRERPEFAHVIGKEAGAVGKRKFYRWVEAVLGGVRAVDRPQGGGVAPDGGEAAAGVIDDAKKRALLAAQKNVPAAPSPAYLARSAATGDANVDFLAMLGGIVHDVDKLRAAAVKPDENQPDGEKIINLHVFDRSIGRRLEVMDKALRVMQEIWDLRYQQKFYDAITEIIVEEMAPYPEVQERVIRRLAELNQRQGMTLYADMHG